MHESATVAARTSRASAPHDWCFCASSDTRKPVVVTGRARHSWWRRLRSRGKHKKHKDPSVRVQFAAGFVACVWLRRLQRAEKQVNRFFSQTINCSRLHASKTTQQQRTCQRYDVRPTWPATTTKTAHRRTSDPLFDSLKACIESLSDMLSKAWRNKSIDSARNLRDGLPNSSPSSPIWATIYKNT